MKHLFAIVTFIMLLCSSSVTEAGPLRRWNQNRLWSPGIVRHLAYERYMVNHSGPRMVWRGDWVPAYMVK